jgi:transposase-like protein
MICASRKRLGYHRVATHRLVAEPMNSIERARAFLHAVRQAAQRTPWDERQCPSCQGHDTWKHGVYLRRVHTLTGPLALPMQRYFCPRCRHTFTPLQPTVAPRHRYGRDVQRFAIDHWLHVGSSLRRTTELVRSLIGHQERWWQWRPWETAPPADPAGRCSLGASTLGRWLDHAGQQARTTVVGQLAGVATSGQFGADGLWAKLLGGAKAVVLLLTDSVTGVAYPPVVVATEDGAEPWRALCRRAARAGLRREQIRGVTSDGARGLGQYIAATLVWVQHQRCVFQVWRNLATPLAEAATQAAMGLCGAAATAVRRATRRAVLPLVRAVLPLVRAVLDAVDDATAVTALRELAAHPRGAGVAAMLCNLVEAVRVYREGWNRGLRRVGPEWWWRDFRLRLSHGRNHRSTARRERAALVWAIYHNFEPAQGRRERKRRYRRSGRSPLAMAGVPPGEVSYLDALAI